MSLMAQYEAAVVRGEIHDDSLQREVLGALQSVADSLVKPKHAWFRRRSKETIKGIYLYGPVGAGKTFLMDLFFHNVAERHKSRVHFHQFMQQIDGQLRRLQGHSDPLKRIAENLSKTIRLLCLDEFLVQDIATAMVLAELMKHLYEHDIILVMTSNTKPDDLYLNGLQRVRFLPAIALIKEHCHVIDLTEHRDYRLGRTPVAKAYLCPLNDETQAIMVAQFNALTQSGVDDGILMVQGREIPTIKRTQQAVWFAFDVICHLPRSQLDYLEIAKRFNTVFVSNIPCLTAKDTVGALLFTHFIDVMYDNRIQVVLSADVPIDELYVEGEVVTAFQRTRSRLQEMQSVDYFKLRYS